MEMILWTAEHLLLKSTVSSGLGGVLSHRAPHPYLKGTHCFIQSLAEQQPLLQRQAESAGLPGEAKALGRPYST